MKARLLKRLRKEQRRVRIILSADGRSVCVFVNGRCVKSIERKKISEGGLYHSPDISDSLIRECREEYIRLSLLDIRQRAHDKEFRDVVKMLGYKTERI